MLPVTAARRRPPRLRSSESPGGRKGEKAAGGSGSLLPACVEDLVGSALSALPYGVRASTTISPLAPARCRLCRPRARSPHTRGLRHTACDCGSSPTPTMRDPEFEVTWPKAATQAQEKQCMLTLKTRPARAPEPRRGQIETDAPRQSLSRICHSPKVTTPPQAITHTLLPSTSACFNRSAPPLARCHNRNTIRRRSLGLIHNHLTCRGAPERRPLPLRTATYTRAVNLRGPDKARASRRSCKGARPRTPRNTPGLAPVAA